MCFICSPHPPHTHYFSPGPSSVFSHQLLKHIESTSPECLLYPGVAGLAEPTPVASEVACSLEEEMVEAVQRQHSAEMEYRQAASTLPR